MSGSSNKTVTLVQPQGGKILRLPSTSTLTSIGSADQPKLMVVSRTKQIQQPTASLGRIS